MLGSESLNAPPASTRDLLNAQAGKLTWPELARHFARGVVISVDPTEDLIEVAECLVKDSSDIVERLYLQGKLHRADDDDAIRWQEHSSEFWAVVVAPWVLVQECDLNRIAERDGGPVHP
jgi:hypothetical protein